MKPLIILLVSFSLALVVLKFINGNYDFPLAGRIGLSVMLLFTAVGHFIYTKGMALMLPGFMPSKTAMVYLTGILEFVFSLGILIPEYRVVTGWALIVFLLLILPSNIYAAVRKLDYQQATFDGNGLGYLWFRIPLQILFIIWTHWFVIKH